jgi:uncharacterized membrane protein
VTRGAPQPENSRIIGIDVARGLALAGMVAVHVFPTFDSDGGASIATAFTSGRAAAVFATMAGVGLAMVTGRRRPVSGGARIAASAGLVVRALLLGLIGLLLGYVTVAGGLDVYVILPYYAVMFLLAVPLLGTRPQTLAVISVLLAAAAGFAILTTVGDVANPSRGIDPTIGDVVAHPVGMLVLLLVGGAYPAVLWLAYICAGLAMGRLDLSSKRVAGSSPAGLRWPRPPGSHPRCCCSSSAACATSATTPRRGPSGPTPACCGSPGVTSTPTGGTRAARHTRERRSTCYTPSASRSRYSAPHSW